ncbi:MAG: sugar-binding transcriptional regulator [Parvibaculaceae bacterium]
MARSPDSDTSRLDEAARAGWLYYIAGNTQEEIARKLGVSRQTAQRLVSLSVSERLIKVRLDHPIARCLDLAKHVTEKFGLRLCEVVPSDPAAPSSTAGVAEAVAAEIERRLESTHPIVLAVGNGKTIRASVEQLPKMDCPQHKVVSTVGNIAPDGTALFYDAIFRMAEAVHAPHYPMPLPVVAASVHERDIFLSQRAISNVVDLARHADVIFVGIGNLGEDAPLHQNGFITREETRALVRIGAVGEIIGWAFDAEGRIIDGLTNDRVTSMRLEQPPAQLIVGAAVGNGKAQAIRGALAGKMITGLITNEAMAEQLLSK